MAIEPMSRCLLVGGPSFGGSRRPAPAEFWQFHVPQVLWPFAPSQSSDPGSRMRGSSALRLHFRSSHHIGTEDVEICGTASVVGNPKGIGLVETFLPTPAAFGPFRRSFISMMPSTFRRGRLFMEARGTCSDYTPFGVPRDVLSFRRSDIRAYRAEPSVPGMASDRCLSSNLLMALFCYIRYAFMSMRSEWSSTVSCANHLDRWKRLEISSSTRSGYSLSTASAKENLTILDFDPTFGSFIP